MRYRLHLRLSSGIDYRFLFVASNRISGTDEIASRAERRCIRSEREKLGV